MLMAVHNRCNTTRRCLDQLDRAATVAGVELRRVIVDDGSTDGTAAMLAEVRRPGDVLVRGDGQLFWAGGMRRAFTELPDLVPYDQLLLLNDDVVLRDDAVLTLLDRAGDRRDRLVVGQIVDPVTEAPTYGGYRRRVSWRPMTMVPATDPDAGTLDGMNANAVLVGYEAHARLGGFAPEFRHGFADFDYAIRANALGLQVLLSRQPVGTCPRDTVVGSWRDRSLSRRARIRHLCSPKGMPPREWALFCWRHGGLCHLGGLPEFVMPWLTILRAKPAPDQPGGPISATTG